MTDKYAKERNIFEEAHAAGMKAGEAHTPRPAGFYRADMNGNRLSETEIVFDGVCGFAWIIVKPGNSRFANFLKAESLGRRDSYYGGVNVWVGYFNQSMEKKEAYADAFAKVLTDHGIKAYSMSRMD